MPRMSDTFYGELDFDPQRELRIHVERIKERRRWRRMLRTLDRKHNLRREAEGR